MRIHSVFLAIAMTSLIAACADESATLTADDDIELLGVDGAKADRSASDAAAVAATYYQIRVDQRRCAFPTCGGYFVSRVNFAQTKCNDGVYRDSCYIVDIDLANGVGLSSEEADAFRADIAAGRALLRGTIKTATYGTQRLGSFAPTEAWRSATTRAPSGTFYKVLDRHIECFVAPCPTYLEYKLNSTRRQPIEEVDLSGAGGDEVVANAVMSNIDQVPVLAVGGNDAYAVSGRAGTRLSATQYYVRVVHGATMPYAPTADELIGKSFADSSAANLYPRTYTFDADTVTVEDAVAPCPAGVMCVWSGYVIRTATWSLAGDRVRLAYTGAETPSTPGITYSDELAVSRDARGNIVLAEVSAEGVQGARQFH